MKSRYTCCCPLWVEVLVVKLSVTRESTLAVLCKGSV